MRLLYVVNGIVTLEIPAPCSRSQYQAIYTGRDSLFCLGLQQSWSGLLQKENARPLRFANTDSEDWKDLAETPHVGREIWHT